MFVRVLKRLLAVALSVLATCGILEIGFRLFAPQLVSPRMVMEAPLGGRRLRPNVDGYLRTSEFNFHVTTNSQGLREAAQEIPAKRSSFRILGLGGSFAFGYGVDADESYLRRTEQCLNRTPLRGVPVEVINAGIPNSGTADQLAFFLDFGQRLAPDLVWLSFIWKHVQDNWYSDLFPFSPGEVQRKVRPEGRSLFRLSHRMVDLIPLFSWLRERSHLLGFASVRLTMLLEELRGRRLDETRPVSDRLREDQWEMTERLLEELVRHSHAVVPARPSFVLMYIPYKFQILEPKGKIERDNAKLAGQIEPRLERFAASRQIPYLSLTERFRAFSDPARLFFRQDWHLTNEGNRLATDVACEFFRQRLFGRP